MLKHLTILISLLLMPLLASAEPTFYYLKPGVSLSDIDTIKGRTSSRYPVGGRVALGFENVACYGIYSWGAELGLGYYGSYRYQGESFINQNYSGIDLAGLLYKPLSHCLAVFGKAGLAYINGSNGASINRATGLLLGAGLNYVVSTRADIGLEFVHIELPHDIPDFALALTPPSFNSLQFYVRFGIC